MGWVNGEAIVICMYLCLHDFWLILFNVDFCWFGFTGFAFFKEISKRRKGSLVFNWFYFILKKFFEGFIETATD